MSSYHFDASAIPPMQEREPIPAGFYPMRITGSETKPTKDNTGQYIAFELEVISGPYAGRKAFDRVTIDNQNQIAVRIGQERLSAYCHATGVIRLTDTQQLHGIPIAVKLSVRKDEGYEPSNDVKAIKNINELPAGATGPATAPAMPPASPPPGMFSTAPTFPPTAAPAPSFPPHAPPAAFAPPPAAPPPPPPAAAPPAPPQFKIGDKANGHVLTAQGWVLDTQPAAPSAAPPWSR